MADSFVYKNGALLYTVGEHHMRVLILRDNVAEETAINTYQLMRAAIRESEASWDYRITPVYYADGIASCVLQHPQTDALRYWLICWDVKDQVVLGSYPLDTIAGIFVRNDSRFLYYGVRIPSQHAGIAIDGGISNHGGHDSIWEIHGLDLAAKGTTKSALELNIRLPEWVGEDIGRTASFEIFDGWFYGISNEQAFEPERNKWNSFYYAFRFRVGHETAREKLPKALSWRRGADEGPVDDRWYTLQLVRDEQTSDIFVYETRKEWKPGAGYNRRNCYHKIIAFPSPSSKKVVTVDDEGQDPKLWDSEAHSDIRSASTTHIGDSSLEPLTFNHYHTLLRSYSPESACFIDLVNDPPASDPDGQRLRLRVRSKAQILGPRAARERDAPTVSLWPAPPRAERPGQNEVQQGRGADEDDDEDTPFMRHVYRIMNPRLPTGRLRWEADERAIVYSPSGAQGDRPRPLILLSFDSGLRLFGLPKPWDQQQPATSAASENDNEIPFELIQKSSVADLDDKGWSSRVQPYYIVINETLPYGYDLTGR
jgi:hypothetical protein